MRRAHHYPVFRLGIEHPNRVLAGVDGACNHHMLTSSHGDHARHAGHEPEQVEPHLEPASGLLPSMHQAWPRITTCAADGGARTHSRRRPSPFHLDLGRNERRTVLHAVELRGQTREAEATQLRRSMRWPEAVKTGSAGAIGDTRGRFLRRG